MTVMPAQHGTFPLWKPVRGGDTTLVEQLETEFAERIETHRLRPGSRLPSVRKMAESAGLSRYTVMEAYERLLARGLVLSRPGAGYFVRSPVEPPVFAEAITQAPPEQSKLDVTWLLREMFGTGQSNRLTAASGILPPHWLDADLIASAIRAAAREDSAGLLQYGHPQGSPQLRRHIAAMLGGQGIAAHPDHHLLMTAGVTHGIDLVLRLMVQRGDTVLVEEPGWPLIFGRLAAYEARIISVPRGREGPDLEVLERLAAEHKPKLFLINSVVHNPTGYTLGAAAAHDILRLAEKYDFMVLEDDTYADFHDGTAIRLASMDRLQRVILVTGYAKTMAAGLRVGVLAARPDIVARLTDLKLLAGLCTPQLGENVMARLLKDGHYGRHLSRLRQRVNQARQKCADALIGCGLTLPYLPPAGIFVWADCGQDSEAVARAASAKGMLLAPGTLFSPTQAPSSMLRFTVSAVEQPELWSVLKGLL
ncbi:PLP-dependent aminotransferase family protein [Gluconobacter cerinus]|uniref:aminotransferase-like domain-containing protein n=1 Tax=Gluconobacter cerinus TaxID=38307 RepID=UPI002011884D|nr:PLP-dependent aminotransferase family protein [Gluconobacter cerinus]